MAGLFSEAELESSLLCTAVPHHGGLHPPPPAFSSSGPWPGTNGFIFCSSLRFAYPLLLHTWHTMAAWCSDAVSLFLTVPGTDEFRVSHAAEDTLSPFPLLLLHSYVFSSWVFGCEPPMLSRAPP